MRRGSHAVCTKVGVIMHDSVFLSVPSSLKKSGCNIFVRLDHITAQERREAAARALQTFNERDLDIWCMGPKNVPGFWFKNEKDAVFFMLMIK